MYFMIWILGIYMKLFRSGLLNLSVKLNMIIVYNWLLQGVLGVGFGMSNWKKKIGWGKIYSLNLSLSKTLWECHVCVLLKQATGKSIVVLFSPVWKFLNPFEHWTCFFFPFLPFDVWSFIDGGKKGFSL